MLKFEGLTKWFGEKCAVSDLSLEVKEGQVLGLLGPNGAGKSTSMKMAAGYLRPSGGQVTLSGHDIWKAPLQAKEHLGYLPERTPLYPDLICQEYLAYIAKLRGLRGKNVALAIDRVIDACFLHQVRRQSIKTLSKGYRHRLCLAQSLLGNPKILIFDEPTDGLDPNQKQEIRDLINHIAGEKAIVISTHILEEVEAVCTDVFIIHHGQKVFSGTPGELHLVSANKRQIDLHLRGGTLNQIIEELTSLDQIQSADLISQDQHHFLLRILLTERTEPSGKLHDQITRLMIENNSSILSFIPDQGEIGQSFRNLTIAPSPNP